MKRRGSGSVRLKGALDPVGDDGETARSVHGEEAERSVEVHAGVGDAALYSARLPNMNGNLSGMRTTIDRAGRLVVPKALRDQAGITAGEVEVSLDGAAIRIESVAGEELVEQDGLLLLPTGGPELSSDEVRELRLADQR